MLAFCFLLNSGLILSKIQQPSQSRTTRLYSSTKFNKDLPSIPVIGPIVAAPPLMIGQEMFLDPPTPLQWKALQECVVEHFNQRKNKNSEAIGGEIGLTMNSAVSATINASPIVAVIDEWTKDAPVFPPHSPLTTGGRYATLAAVVGISKNKSAKLESYGEETSFVDYVENSDIILPLSSSVRLVGIGRAALRGFFYRVPSELDEHEDLDFDDGYEDRTPIVMAEFEPLVDDASIYSNTDPNLIGNKGVRSYRSSPVHALSALYNLVNRVEWIHDDRRKLVTGLIAAKARLRMSVERKDTEVGESLIDHDGFGALFERNVGMTIEELLDRFEGTKKKETTETKSQLDMLESRENWGLAYYAAFSTIAELTKVTVASLEPYYSQSFRDREEFEAEISSFIAFRVLEGYVTKKDITWCLICTSSLERLERALDILIDHKVHLQKLVNRISDELKACGEECTDLW